MAICHPYGFGLLLIRLLLFLFFFDLLDNRFAAFTHGALRRVRTAGKNYFTAAAFPDARAYALDGHIIAIRAFMLLMHLVFQ